MMRIDKFLCACSIGTRSEVKKYIKAGLVTINGQTAKKPEQKVDETVDEIIYNGKKLNYEEYRYYVFFKRAGFITAVTDATHKTIIDDLPEELRTGISPVGRLDKDTEGLIILTNDGEFTHHILSPTHHIKKTYYCELDYELPDDAVLKFKNGLDIGDDKLTLPAELEILEPYQHANGHTRYRANITIHEGRYHQVKRMFRAVGCKVLYLKRLSIGDLTLEGLGPGDVRKLTDEEIIRLRES